MIFIVFSLPGVQTRAGKELTNSLNKTYDVDIRVGRVGVSYFGKVNLNDILIRDHHQDTLIYAQNLATSILSLKEIIDGKPVLGNADLYSVLFNMKKYKGEDVDNLMVFTRKFNRNRKQKKDFILTADQVDLNEARFYYTDENIQEAKILDFSNIQLEAEALKIEGPDIYLDVNELSFISHRGLEVHQLSTSMSIANGKMQFQDLYIKTENSDLTADILFSYPDGMTDFVNKVNVEADFKTATISTDDLILFYKEFGQNQNLQIKNTRLKGILNDFQLLDTNIKGLGRSVVRGDIRIKNVFDRSAIFQLSGDFTNITTNYYDLINLLPRILGKSLPKQLYQLGSVKAVGNTVLTQNDVDVDMNFYSRLGDVNAFVLLGNLENIKKATYTGSVVSDNFDIGRILGKERLGTSAFDINVDGSGFTLENLNTRVEGNIKRVEFNGYAYKDIEVIGNLRDPVFDGILIANDPNVKLKFKGVADFSEAISNYDFIANVDHIDLKKLELFTRDSISMFNGDVIMNMKGKNINDAFGTISFEKTLYRNQDAGYYFDDFKITSSFDEENVRTITINSPDIIEGSVKGIFRFENVYDLFRNSIGSLYTNFEATEITDNEFMEFNFNIYNKILEVFFPEVEFAPNTFIKGKVESDDSEFKLTFKSPSIKAFDNELQKVDIQVDNKNPVFNTYISIDSIDTKYYDVSNFSLINVTLKDTLFMRSEFTGGLKNSDTYNLDFYHTINEDNNSVIGFKKSDFTFKGYTWFANANQEKKNNKIIFDNKFSNVRIKDIQLRHKDEEILLSGTMQGKSSKNIKASFADVDLHKITPTILNFALDGRVDGDLILLEEDNQYLPSSTITINDFAINKVPYGELRLNAYGNESLTEFKVNTRLIDPSGEKTVSAIGGISVVDKNALMDIDVAVTNLDLTGFSELGGIVLSNLRGKISGDATIGGNFKDPSIDGLMRLRNAGLKIPYLEVDLDFEQDARVELSQQRFYFDNIALTDTKYKTKGILGGYIDHRRFSRWNLDLTIDAPDRFLVLDTKGNDESLYYGTGFISGNSTIKGATTDLVIAVDATTEEGTIFKIPLNDTETLGDNSFIHFLTPEEKQARIEGKDIIIEELKGLELKFDLDVNNNAEVEVVVDKESGSSLRGRGAGTLLIEINTNGKFNMWGDFIAYQGSYNFRYGAFLGKDFTVRSGGSINWDGSPTRAILDLSAVYKTEANPAVLLENASVNRKIPVEVVVDLKGELIQPDLTFNIELPNLGSVAKSELEYQLEDQSTKELQALSLVTQGQFYSGTLDPSFITGNLVERAAGLVNGIFSDDDDKFQVGLNYIQGNRNLDQQASDQFGVTLSTQINNNILINGRVGVPIGGVSESIVTGDIEIEYLFNEKGNFRGTIFNRQNEIQYIGESQGYKQGLGLSYSVDFDNFNELWKKIFDKRVKTDTLPTKKIDTIPLETPDFINFTDEDVR